MGMDGVEILVEVEDAFGIELDDREVTKIVTVGDLCELVLSIVPRATQERCLTALAFWRLRAALGSMGVERARVRSDTPLEEVVWCSGQSAADRRMAWARLAATLRLDLPPLARSRTLIAVSATTCLCAFSAVLLASRSTWQAAAGAIALALLLGITTRSRRGYRPASLATVGDLARALVLRQSAKIAAPTGGFTRPQVEAIVARIIADYQGLPLERVTLGARLVADLAVD